jgi:DNA-binding MarR family transcriptional regulator
MTAPAVPADIRLDDQLCLALYRASRAMTSRYRPLLAELGLTYPQYLVLLLLWEEGTTSVSGIGGRLGLESSTLSPLLRRLEAMGLVRRSRGTGDERTVDISLTAEGDQLRVRASDVPTQICEATGLDADERAAMVVELRTLIAALSR